MLGDLGGYAMTMLQYNHSLFCPAQVLQRPFVSTFRLDSSVSTHIVPSHVDNLAHSQPRVGIVPMILFLHHLPGHSSTTT